MNAAPRSSYVNDSALIAFRPRFPLRRPGESDASWANRLAIAEEYAVGFYGDSEAVRAPFRGVAAKRPEED